MRKVEIGPVKPALIIADSDRSIVRQDRAKHCEDIPLCLSCSIFKELQAAITREGKEVTVEGSVEPITRRRRVLNGFEARLEAACLGSNFLRILLRDNLAILEKAEEQRATNKGEAAPPAVSMREPIGTFLQQIEHLLEDLIRR